MCHRAPQQNADTQHRLQWCQTSSASIGLGHIQGKRNHTMLNLAAHPSVVVIRGKDKNSCFAEHKEFHFLAPEGSPQHDGEAQRL